MKKTVIALVILAILFASWLFLKGSDKPKEEPVSQPTVVFSCNKDEISEVSITNKSLTINLLKTGGVWKLKSDEKAVLLDEAMASLDDKLSLVLAQDVITENADDLNLYGLTNPSAVVRFVVNGEEKYIYLGNSILDDTKYYFTMDKKAVYTMSMADVGLYYSDIQAFRDMTAFKINAEKMVKGTIVWEDGRFFKLEKKPTEEKLFAFSLLEPVQANVDADKAIAFFKRFTPLMATKIGEGELKPVATVTLESEDKTVSTIIVGDGAVKLPDSNVIYYMDTSFVNVNSFDVIDKHIVIQYINDVDEVVFEKGDIKKTIKINEDTKDLYQSLVLLSYDNIAVKPYGDLKIKITLKLKNGQTSFCEYYDYDSMSYAIKTNGVNGLTIKKKFVDKVIKGVIE